VAVAIATLRFMQQLLLQLCASCGSWRFNSELLAAVGAATLHFMHQLGLQLCASFHSWGCNYAFHVAVGSATPRFIMWLFAVKLCTSCSSWD
jgi:hypothetical protein